jgi:hypothetical protein
MFKKFYSTVSIAVLTSLLMGTPGQAVHEADLMLQIENFEKGHALRTQQKKEKKNPQIRQQPESQTWTEYLTSGLAEAASAVHSLVVVPVANAGRCGLDKLRPELEETGNSSTRKFVQKQATDFASAQGEKYGVGAVGEIAKDSNLLEDALLTFANTGRYVLGVAKGGAGETLTRTLLQYWYDNDRQADSKIILQSTAVALLKHYQDPRVAVSKYNKFARSLYQASGLNRYITIGVRDTALLNALIEKEAWESHPGESKLLLTDRAEGEGKEEVKEEAKGEGKEVTNAVDVNYGKVVTFLANYIDDPMVLPFAQKITKQTLFGTEKRDPKQKIGDKIAVEAARKNKILEYVRKTQLRAQGLAKTYDPFEEYMQKKEAIEAENERQSRLNSLEMNTFEDLFTGLSLEGGGEITEEEKEVASKAGLKAIRKLREEKMFRLEGPVADTGEESDGEGDKSEAHKKGKEKNKSQKQSKKLGVEAVSKQSPIKEAKKKKSHDQKEKRDESDDEEDEPKVGEEGSVNEALGEDQNSAKGNSESWRVD